MKKVLIVIANNGFQDYEFGVPFDMFTHAGISVSVAAGKIGECIGVFGSKTVADIELEKVKGENYDMIIFIGGGGAYAQYFGNKDYFRVAKEAKKLGAICIAPMILSASGIFNGKTVTSRDQNGVQKKFIQDNGGFWVNKNVVVSGNIVTANGPESAKEFAEKCLEMINS